MNYAADYLYYANEQAEYYKGEHVYSGVFGWVNPEWFPWYRCPKTRPNTKPATLAPRPQAAMI